MDFYRQKLPLLLELPERETDVSVRLICAPSFHPECELTFTPSTDGTDIRLNALTTSAWEYLSIPLHKRGPLPKPIIATWTSKLPLRPLDLPTLISACAASDEHCRLAMADGMTCEIFTYSRLTPLTLRRATGIGPPVWDGTVGHLLGIAKSGAPQHVHAQFDTLAQYLT